MNDSDRYRIRLDTFGQIFSSRPEGRETGLTAIAHHLGSPPAQHVEIDFDNVLVMTPGWLSEFIQTLKAGGVKSISFENLSNLSVAASVEIIEEFDQSK